MWSSKNRTKVCEWMGYAVGDLRTSLGHGEVWIGVPVQCYMECNRNTAFSSLFHNGWKTNLIMLGKKVSTLNHLRLYTKGCD